MENMTYLHNNGSLLIFEAKGNFKTAFGAEVIANISLAPYNMIVERSPHTHSVVVVVLKSGAMHTIVSDEYNLDELFDVLMSAWEEAREATGYRCTINGGGS
jgi:hypothetical protein